MSNQSSSTIDQQRLNSLFEKSSSSSNSSSNNSNHPLTTNDSNISLTTINSPILQSITTFGNPKDISINKTSPSTSPVEELFNQSFLGNSIQSNTTNTSPDLDLELNEFSTVMDMMNSVNNMNVNQQLTETNTAPKASIKTDVSSTVKNEKGKVIKRKYSRNGCTECKKRRMKCDETKPICWQCSRLNRSCIYILNPKNKKRNSTTSPTQQQQTTTKTKSKSISESRSLSESKLPTTTTTTAAVPVMTATRASDILNNIDLSPLQHTTASASPPKQVANPLTHNYFLSNDDSQSLLQDLNDIINMKLNDYISLNNGVAIDVYDNNSINNNMGKIHTHIPNSICSKDVIQFNINLEETFPVEKQHLKYMKFFVNQVLNIISPFFENQPNPLKDIFLSFAKYEPYLMSAILAIGASSLYRLNGEGEDNKNYGVYLNNCLNLLDNILAEVEGAEDKIESIILTMMLLTWDCIHTMDNQWRLRLKNVVGLFKRLNKETTTKNDSSIRNSKVLNLSRCWFKIMETFASISTELGGSLSDLNDIEIIFDSSNDYEYMESLKNLNVITQLNGFNLLRGHREDFDLVIKRVLQCLHKLRVASKGTTDDDNGVNFFEISKILVEIDKQLEYQFIDKSGIIPLESPSHPLNSGIHDNAIDRLNVDDKDVYVSWYDITHQVQVLSFLLIVQLKIMKLENTNAMVQQVIRRVLKYFEIFNLQQDETKMNTRSCYCNFAISLCGMNVSVEDTTSIEIIRNYYRMNRDKFNRLSEYNLRKLENLWGIQKQDNSDETQLTTTATTAAAAASREQEHEQKQGEQDKRNNTDEGVKTEDVLIW
ncbi:hypothetical protein TBLA_0I01890 [Henningerozyma blattae CBS 6284]|uniref:Zn(2)-C6 fungal-type domain-containing protein n=1 Tax=Henningerozyma blattae (strain ATCC 34711 / CBS 6284 / DSM 70876 / NBRC 10599 / NRRL Y-10934 / UCD 77-7) TaxID=1071380 RepID=I2H8Z5_HENB6|nr:hypothetical protein TBLA_0I01890 [Tetrapisispora blattae CBS 6284]CCH62847.1 hypothetical protein TBLA_0I01890 [Tetrapisispora blattae CBS 6284]